MPAPRDCPCHSGRRYKACCAELHAGRAVADTPEALMRSRFAAFALGLGGYLVETLSTDHPDRGLPADSLARELGRAKDRQRFLDLCIPHTSVAAGGREGEVLFHARIFERGVDRSFAELSSFVREDGGWRYAGGLLLETARLPANVRAMTREDFLARLERP